MEYLLLVLPIAAIAYSFKILRKAKRAVCYHQWKALRDNLTLEQFVQSIESEYYRAVMRELYK
jgi:hypothetical protein